jgi:hypothetical protein
MVVVKVELERVEFLSVRGVSQPRDIELAAISELTI